MGTLFSSRFWYTVIFELPAEFISILPIYHCNQYNWNGFALSNQGIIRLCNDIQVFFIHESIEKDTDKLSCLHLSMRLIDSMNFYSVFSDFKVWYEASMHD